MDFRHRFTLKMLAFYMLVFTLFRFALFFMYHDYFSSIRTGYIFLSFIDGLRFDISIILTFIGFPLFLMNLPIRNKIWLKILTLIASIEFFAMFLLLSGNLIYFDIVKRHLGDDLLLAINDVDFVVDFALKQFWYILIIILTSFIFYLRFLFKSINRNTDKRKIKPVKEILLQIVIILLVIIGIRGTFGNKPINVINAFSGGSGEYGNLTLNGVFCSYHVSRNSSSENHNFYKNADAQKYAASMIIENDEVVNDENYPFYRHRFKANDDSVDNKQLNVVIFLLESWTPEYIDCLSGKKYGVTPNLDTIAANGINFTNAYANGDRSIYGITASLLGIPQIIGIPYLGTGLELSNIMRMGKILGSKGYRTIFAQTSKRGSYHVDAIATSLGFKEYYGQQDFPKAYNYMTKETPYFGWDYEAYMFLMKKLSKERSPFFTYLFTGTTHEAFVLPDKKFEKYPHQRNDLNGYLNSLYYADWSIGQFMNKAKKEDWFENTIFIFTADHVSRFVEDNMNARFKIPLIIYAPDILKPKEKSIIASQADIPATVFDLLGLYDNYSGIGKSLIKDYDDRFVISRRGNTMVFFNEYGYLQHNLKEILEYGFNNKVLDTTQALRIMKKNLLSVDQSLYNLLKSNKFFK